MHKTDTSNEAKRLTRKSEKYMRTIFINDKF